MSEEQITGTVKTGAADADNASGEARWYIVHTYSGYENKVLTTLKQKVENMGLQDQIQELAIPVEKVREIAHRKQKDSDGDYVRDEDGDIVEEEYEVVKEYKIFPSYVFIKMVMTDDNQNVVRSVRGCTGFVGLNSMNATEKIDGVIIHNAPPALTPSEVAEIGLENGPAEEAAAEFRSRFKPGDSVRIVGNQCPFEDPVCVVESVDEASKTVTVTGNMFGRRVPVEVPEADVEPA